MKRQHNTKKLPDPVFFTDRDLGKRFPQVLRELGITVQPIHEHLTDPCAGDDVWLRLVGDRGWLALTRDLRIRYTPQLVKAAMEAGVGMFEIKGAVPHDELARGFVRAFPKVLRYLARHPRPFIGRVYRRSSGEFDVKHVLSLEEWRVGLVASSAKRQAK